MGAGSTAGAVLVLVFPEPQMTGSLAGSESDERTWWAFATGPGRSRAAARGQGLVDERLPGTADGVGQVELSPDVDEQRAVDVVEQVARAALPEDQLVGAGPVGAVAEVVRPPRCRPVVVGPWKQDRAEGAFGIEPPQLVGEPERVKTVLVSTSAEN